MSWQSLLRNDCLGIDWLLKYLCLLWPRKCETKGISISSLYSMNNTSLGNHAWKTVLAFDSTAMHTAITLIRGFYCILATKYHIKWVSASCNPLCSYYILGHYCPLTSLLTHAQPSIKFCCRIVCKLPLSASESPTLLTFSYKERRLHTSLVTSLALEFPWFCSKQSSKNKLIVELLRLYNIYYI